MLKNGKIGVRLGLGVCNCQKWCNNVFEQPLTADNEDIGRVIIHVLNIDQSKKFLIVGLLAN